jgi:ABC-type uncharacterized transport system ATPase subunit
MSATPTATPVLQLEGIVKRYGANLANDHVDFDLRAGETHALLGENGAGKTTLMSILYGLVRPDAGAIRVDGRAVEISSPRSSIELGIGMVHQHFMLVPVMTVAENLVLGAEPRRGGVELDRRAATALVEELSARHGLAVDPSARIEDLSVGEQQRVEILRALYRGARVLVLDEPTAVLAGDEVDQLLDALDALKAQGTSIVFISHKLPEVLRVADRVTVLRRGRRIDTVAAAGATEHDLARLMVGRDVMLDVPKAPARPSAEPLLRVRGLTVRDDRELPAVRDLSLDVRRGEIVALAGVDGNGQRELVEALTGLRAPVGGAIELDGRELGGRSVREIARAGVGYVAEDRHRRGLVLDFGIAENLILRETRERGTSAHGWLRRGRVRERAARIVEEFDVRAPDLVTPVSALSGGNQQKVVIAREIARNPSLLIAAQPTRGLDVGAIEIVHRRLVAERDAGRAILLVSLELEEVRSLADRILVICEGRIVAELAAGASEHELGLAMSGVGSGSAAGASAVSGTGAGAGAAADAGAPQ